MSEIIRFPPGFVWGAATSAHQVEGGNRWNDWWRFEQIPGAILHGDTSGDACRHWERYDEDFRLAAADGHRAHRLSIEWSRIEPAPGAFDAAAVAHYHDVFDALRRHGLEPWVTLHHFTNPLWIADHGGWESRETIDAFVRFARFCAREYGGQVDWWCTINEPDVYAFRSYSEGLWPPRKRDDGAALCVIANLLEAHGRAYRALHEDDRVDADGDGHAARVGFAKHLVQLEPARAWFPLDALRAWFEDRVFNRAVMAAPVRGDIELAIPGAKAVKRHVAELAGALDWLGINYYTRWLVKATGPVPHVARPGAPVNDLGWEVWPEGLAEAARRAHAAAQRVRPGTPVVFTEHGFADAADALRPRALVASLAALGRAIASGADVRAYFHWSLLDNFEWAEGYHGRFGLYAVDFADPERPRSRTQSAELYARIASDNAVQFDEA
jgi:beta-glucosidase